MFRHNGAQRFWEDLVNELNEEFPEDEEDDYEDSEDEDLDESLKIIPDNKLEERKHDPLASTFMQKWTKASETPFARRILNILNAYGDVSETNVEEIFRDASENDKIRMVELASIATNN